jgi:hypothetical protein
MSMKRCFMMSKDHLNAFSTFWVFKKAIWTKSRKWNLIRRMALRTHILPSGRLKKQLCWSRWSDVSRCRNTRRNHFLHPGHRKKRLGWSRLSDVLIRRRALRTHKMPSGRLKNDFGEVDKAIFQVSKSHANSFSASWASKKATLTKLLKWCF